MDGWMSKRLVMDVPLTVHVGLIVISSLTDKVKNWY